MRLGFLAFTFVLSTAPALAGADVARWHAQAARVTIVRDDWGIAHVRGRSDGDAVFGMAYVQAEDGFARIENNYLTALGRKAEADGEGAIWEDLRQRLFIDPAELRRDFARSPVWLKWLMVAWADGLNFYLSMHPHVHPRVLTRFEPWMALSFAEGSIGSDIESVDVAALAAFYGKEKIGATAPREEERSASNGIAIAPALSESGHALLLINPHTSLFFRSELQMTSGQGLDAYGAVTWGQFFVYQGFNAHMGWMHTSAHVDNIDEFAETVAPRGGRLSFKHGGRWWPVRTRSVSLRYRTAGGVAAKTFTAYFTQHGPVVRQADGKWIAVSLMNRPAAALEQSFLRTKANSAAAFLKIAERKANSSNNTVFADDSGHIGFVVPQFVPKRDDRFDYTTPVDGTDPAADWHGLTPLSQLPQAIDPPTGWVMNTNDWPWSAAGPAGPHAEHFPRYLDTAGENERGVHATRLLSEDRRWTLDSLRAAAFDPDMPAFARLIPPLVAAWDRLPDADPGKSALKDQIALLRVWDRRWNAASVETTLAVLWADEVRARPGMPAAPVSLADIDKLAAAPDFDKLAALTSVSDRLTRDFGAWRVVWGEMNRFQRADTFDDSKPSRAVPFAASRWGTLASFAAKRFGTARYYGTSGNSFVAVVEFGPKVVARAVMAGGADNDPASPHFADQTERYASGNLRPVYFYREDLAGHTERVYHPGAN